MKEQYLKESDFIFSGNAIFIQEMYRKFLQNPEAVSQEWQEYFANVGDQLNDLASDYDGAPWKRKDLKVIGAKDPNQAKQKTQTKDKSLELVGDNLEYKAARLINRFRRYGHLIATLDPLGLTKKEYPDVLTTEFHDLKETELDDKVSLEFEPHFTGKTINEILKKLHRTYSYTIAFEFEYISSIEEKMWFRRCLETREYPAAGIAKEDKISALNHLHRAVSFEQTLHKKFPGTKRFSVEGGEAIIPALEKIIDLSGKSGVDNIEIGMAHRGRLNVLTNICEKPYDQMIAEFKGTSSIPSKYEASGDVKYHMGYSCDRAFGKHKTHVSLAYNPSHLEAVNPVVFGKVRAKQEQHGDVDKKKNIPILIHGDAAMMGQGIVAEGFNMAYVDAYNVGGTIHFIVNNQIGFTANRTDSRSTKYASDVAKFIDAPIIHVNGEDVDNVITACEIAFDYRQKFGKDIVIDIVCYRKYGHNEGDEPNYTQPIMYGIIKKMKSLDEIYAAQLESEGVFSSEEYKKLKADRAAVLEDAYKKSDKFEAVDFQTLSHNWTDILPKYMAKKHNPETGVAIKDLSKTLDQLLTIPDSFKANSKIVKQFQVKKDVFNKDKKIDWALGESLAFATLLTENNPIRITGQDAKRGTFSHRHSVLRDSGSEEEYIPLNHLQEKQAKYYVADSVLSEYGVLGFEYGYSLSNPSALTIWEAQFGDFSNGAQIMIDQFITSGETKWLRMSGLVMLLPHAYEGQGPEHSSARLERYLQSCAEDNIQVANCTTPANFFHILRRQIHRDFRKPLVIMSPKSLLRHKLAVSDISELDKGTSFKPVLAETEKLVADEKVKKVVLCSGKVYYDLLDARTEMKINDVALLRVEELYPFPEELVVQELKKYKNAEVVWCQEEPENMGAWNFIDRRLEAACLKAKSKSSRPQFVGRVAAASPATGYASVHNREQKKLIEEALK
jgi:2-oxoglutarate dehydrogenase E1 component